MKHKTKDRVIPKRHLAKKHLKLECVDVSKGNVTLLDLSIAAAVVRSHDDGYCLLKGQSYWYCDMIMRVLEETHELVVDRTRSKAADDEWVAAAVAAESGKWSGFSVDDAKKDRNDHVKVLADAFQSARERVKAEVRIVNTGILLEDDS
jgi:hypothetical protein